MAFPAYFAPFIEILAEEGFRPRVPEDGEESFVHFKWEGTQFMLAPDAREPEFLHIIMSYEMPSASSTDLMERANQLNDEWKVVKTVLEVARRAVDFHFEAYFDDRAGAARLLQRALPALRSAAVRFFAEPQLEQSPVPDGRDRAN